MSLEARVAADGLRKARDAETAHLEAVLKVNGAKYLRLAHLRDLLSPLGSIELKAEMGDEPQLWLDLSHRVTMDPDAKTYHLAYIAPNQINTLLQTGNLEEAVKAAENVIAHHAVNVERAGGQHQVRMPASPAWRHATLVYVWLTGVITGGAALAMYLIYLKKMVF